MSIYRNRNETAFFVTLIMTSTVNQYLMDRKMVLYTFTSCTMNAL